ncbi:hypothetical protein STPH1_6237 [Streptomyces sp. OM5714]|nr:hypothetical protein STPH1_6237 [Streptomyces sp. OM5714]
MAAYIGENGFFTHYLDDSFRWGTDRQAWLTRRLRRCLPVTLSAGFARDADIVLALKWKALWESDPRILPLAIKPGVGQVQEAICTLLLNEVAQNALAMQAVFLHDALVTLGLEREVLATTLRPCLQSAITGLKGGDQPALVWQRLTGSLAVHIPAIATTQFTRKPLRALSRIQLRLANDRMIPGLTAHQSKGREWNTVAVRLSPADAAALAHGLDPARSDHRALYVALTRARLNTIALT